MILKGLVKNIKKQDWFSVFLELGIVILGIYLGFQVTQWQADNETRVAETQLLLRLSEDLESLVSRNTRIISGYEKQLKLFDEALDFVKEEGSWKQNHDTWRKRLQPLMGYTDPVVQLPVYQEIVATAQLSYIKDPRFRTELTRFAYTLENTAGANEAITDLYAPAYQNIFEHLIVLREFPELINRDQEQLKIQLLKDVHTMRNSVSLVRIFTRGIKKDALALIDRLGNRSKE